MVTRQIHALKTLQTYHYKGTLTSHKAFIFGIKNASMNNGKRGKWSDPITGLFATNHNLIYFGDISEKQANGYTRKVSFLFFVFKYDNSRMVIFEYPNYYPPANEVSDFISRQIGYIKNKLGL